MIVVCYVFLGYFLHKYNTIRLLKCIYVLSLVINPRTTLGTLFSEGWQFSPGRSVRARPAKRTPPTETKPTRTLDVVRILCPSWSSPLPPSSPMTPRLLLPAVKHPHHHRHHRTTVITAARSLVSSSFHG